MRCGRKLKDAVVGSKKAAQTNASVHRAVRLQHRARARRCAVLHERQQQSREQVKARWGRG